MIRRVVLLGLLMLGTPLAAQSVKLQAHEITALLSGNTAVGRWEGVPYRQHFGPDGSTIYAQEGARSALGKWRVDAARDEYQSIWPRDADWEGWYVMEYAGDFYWVSKSTPPTPFKVLEGQQLIAQTGQTCGAITDWARGVGAATALGVKALSAPACGTSLGLSGETSVHCNWGYPYRSPDARAVFNALGAELQACFEGQAGLGEDALVNHPDSYDLLSFDLDGGTLSLSLKDKGALEQTYIFLRAEGVGR